MSNHRAGSKGIVVRHDTWSAAGEMIGQRTLERDKYLTNTQEEAQVTGTS